VSQIIGGHCGKCGAPYYLPGVWHGIVPPTPMPTCACWNVPQTVTTSHICCTCCTVCHNCMGRKVYLP
jgi:hypothetical protein